MTSIVSNNGKNLARGRSHQRIRPLVALGAFWKVMQDPDDTESGARLVLSLDGNRGEQNYLRFAAHPHGAQVLAERRDLAIALSDRESLSALPTGSLGRAYLRFMEEEGITAEGLASAVAPVERELAQISGDLDASRQLFSARIRALHDLWHVVTGYSRDLMGELLLLAFSYEQLHTRAYRWMVPLAGFVNEFRIPGTRDRIELARNRARNSPWLPTENWERMLGEPLEDVRTQLGLGSPPPYERYYRNPSGFGLIPEAEYRATKAA